MTDRFLVRRIAALVLPVLFLCLPPCSAGSQEPEKDAKSSGSKASEIRKDATNSTANESKASNRKNVLLLTREYAAVTQQRPQVVEKVEIPGASFIREWYRVEWRAQDPFYLYVIRPKGVAKPPVILYLPSFPDDTDLFTKNNWCDLAVRGGYATVGFVGAVTGHRTRFRLLKEWFVSEMPEALSSTTHDVQMILDYLASRGDFDMEHVGMYGAGSGGAIAILASVVDARIKVLDLLAPWGDWKTWLNESKVIREDERATYTKPEFVTNVVPLDPVTWIGRIHATSLRIENIRGNKAMPDAAQEKLEAAAPDFAVINQYGNGRAFLATQSPPAVLEWAKAQLAPNGKPSLEIAKSQRIHFFPALQPLPPPAGIQDLANTTSPQPAKSSVASKDKEKDKANPN